MVNYTDPAGVTDKNLWQRTDRAQVIWEHPRGDDGDGLGRRAGGARAATNFGQPPSLLPSLPSSHTLLKVPMGFLSDGKRSSQRRSRHGAPMILNIRIGALDHPTNWSSGHSYSEGAFLLALLSVRKTTLHHCYCLWSMPAISGSPAERTVNHL